MAFTGSVFHLHGLPAGKKKELGALIEEHGGVVTYIFGKTVCVVHASKSNIVLCFRPSDHSRHR